VPVVPALETSRYYSYQELSDYLRIAEEAAPHLLRLFTVGTSYEGRPILLAEVTNGAKGQGLEKPAIWIDGGFKGGELLGSSACLDLVRQLVSDYGRDPMITDLLDHCTFYIVPRPAPDVAEHCIMHGEVLPASARPYPRQDSDINLRPADINGDRRILQMRILDDSGGWKLSRRDPRLMVRRQPDDRGGPFYRLLPEGFVEGSQGPIKALNLRSRLHFERNFPSGWREESEAPGSGPYPLSEPETRCVADFFRSHANICICLSCGTVGGRIVYPSLNSSRFKAFDCDQRLFQELSKRLEEITGYRSGPHPSSEGSLIQWCFESLGLLSFQPQLWCIGRAVGLEVADSANFALERGELDSLSVLRWLDREAPNVGYVPWTSIQHPQLGAVELGGWDSRYSFLNPPPGNFIQDSSDRFVKMTVTLASGLPRLRLRKVAEEVIGWTELTPPDAAHGQFKPIRKLTVEIENSGYLSSWVTQQARERKNVGNLEIRIHHDSECEIQVGKSLTVVPPLPGCNALMQFNETTEPHESWSRFDWVVRGTGLVQAEFLQEKSGVAMVSWSGEPAQNVGAGHRDTRTPVPPVQSAPPPPPPVHSNVRHNPGARPGVPAAPRSYNTVAMPGIPDQNPGYPTNPSQPRPNYNTVAMPVIPDSQMGYPTSQTTARGPVPPTNQAPHFGNQPNFRQPAYEPLPEVPTHQPPQQPHPQSHQFAPTPPQNQPSQSAYAQPPLGGPVDPRQQSGEFPNPRMQPTAAPAEPQLRPTPMGLGEPAPEPFAPQPAVRGRVLGQPPAKPGAIAEAAAAEAQKNAAMAQARPAGGLGRPAGDEDFSPGLPIRDNKPQDGGSFAPGLPIKPASATGTTAGPAETIASMDFDIPPPEAPAAESRVPTPLFLRKKRP
jgi:hypothetical protein